MREEEGPQQSSAAWDSSGSPQERLNGSVREYVLPFEPVGIEDWEALGG